MVNKSLVDEIITIVKSEANNNPAPVACTVNKVYNGYVDIVLSDGTVIRSVRCLGDAVKGSDAVLVFLDGTYSNMLVVPPSYITDENDSTSALLDAVQKYNLTSSDMYTLFRGDCWTINNNFECSAAITSESDTDFTVTGTFRTKQDMVGVYWNSKDLITHPYISYGENYDYSDVVLEFDYEMSGCTDFNSGDVSLTINNRDGSIDYFDMDDFVDDGHVTIDFSDLDDFDPSSIDSIMLVLVPTNYSEASTWTIMSNVDFTLEVSNIEVTNGDIKHEHISLEPHQYRLCEGYDDIYNINPRRLVKEMRKLGYVDWVDLYIGASHYYEKSGTVDDVITSTDFDHNRTEKMVLDDTVPLNKSFSAWLDCYAKELKDNDVNNLIISVSMENLQCPTSWRQRTSTGDYAETDWTPSTFFYSPTNSDVISYMQSVSSACLDILEDNNLPPILQLGEAWWWWNESSVPNQPPCFYDDATKSKYYSEFGSNIPLYASSSETHSVTVTSWLNKQLVAYSDKLRSIAKSYNGQYMALFFPPSVLDSERVPVMMREANYIVDAYHPSKLDILELEDYDWVTSKSNHHKQVYSIGESLGFPVANQHYYGGFVLDEDDAVEYWSLIKEAMDTAFDKGFGEVFVWAGTQIRRDAKIIGHEEFEFVQDLLGKICTSASTYVHPSSKQCDYVYTHPSSKQCDAVIPEAYVHPSNKQCDYEYVHPSTQQCNAEIPTLTPTQVYTCNSFNTTYINTTGATNLLSLYKLGSLYLLRYFITTKSLPNHETEYLVNNDEIASQYRPGSDVTFHVATSSNHNAKIRINTSGQIRISTDTDNTAISLAGTVVYWW